VKLFIGDSSLSVNRKNAKIEKFCEEVFSRGQSLKCAVKKGQFLPFTIFTMAVLCVQK